MTIASIVEHDAIDFITCIDGSARVVIDDVLPDVARSPEITRSVG